MKQIIIDYIYFILMFVVLVVITMENLSRNLTKHLFENREISLSRLLLYMFTFPNITNPNITKLYILDVLTVSLATVPYTTVMIFIVVDVIFKYLVGYGDIIDTYRFLILTNIVILYMIKNVLVVTVNGLNIYNGDNLKVRLIRINWNKYKLEVKTNLRIPKIKLGR